jgi:SAM-dependent methyltransferase
MKICIKCGSRFALAGWRCPACGFEAVCSDGVRVLLTDRHAAPKGYDISFFHPLAQLEDKSFWFRARTRLIVWAVGRYFPASRNVLEVGAGTGCVLAGMAAAFPRMQFHASEPFSEGLAFARDRVARATFLQMDAKAIPFVEEFDLIGAFDVLEHIVEDELVLEQIYGAVAPGGGILLTVPQHDFLWSRQDDVAGHQRRYSAGDLRRKVERAGFRVRRMTSFVSLLLPAMLASRLWKDRGDAPFDALDELRVNAGLNSVMEFVMDCERTLVRAGISFPAGGSLLLVGEKT